jgi:DNA-binding GntR family transcriptional regulator
MGAKLLTVAELMAATGLGQTSVCKALNELEREGNVRRSPRKTAGRAELWQTTMTV